MVTRWIAFSANFPAPNRGAAISITRFAVAGIPQRHSLYIVTLLPCNQGIVFIVPTDFVFLRHPTVRFNHTVGSRNKTYCASGKISEILFYHAHRQSLAENRTSSAQGSGAITFSSVPRGAGAFLLFGWIRGPVNHKSRARRH